MLPDSDATEGDEHAYELQIKSLAVHARGGVAVNRGRVSRANRQWKCTEGAQSKRQVLLPQHKHVTEAFNGNGSAGVPFGPY